MNETDPYMIWFNLMAASRHRNGIRYPYRRPKGRRLHGGRYRSRQARRKAVPSW